MADIGKYWAGNAYGTNTGNLFAEIESKAGQLVGTLRFMDSNFGLTLYDVTGSFDGSELKLEGTPRPNQPALVLGKLHATAMLTPNGSLRGHWNTEIGTAGTFTLFPHDLPVEPQAPTGQGPEQLYTQRLNVDAVRLYADDVRALVQTIAKDFISAPVVVTYRSDKVEHSKYLPAFETEAPRLGKLDYFRLNVQEPDLHGLNKVAIVELNSRGPNPNQITVQGANESWVIGKAEALSRQLAHNKKSLANGVKKFGVSFNQIVVLAMLLLAPDVHPVWRRVVFGTVVVALLITLWVLHQRYIPMAAVYPGPKLPGTFTRAWPSILSWVSAMTAALAAAFAFYLLSGHSPP
jgi:hypothetical protein